MARLEKLRNYNAENNTRHCKGCNLWKDLSLFSTRKIVGKMNLQLREKCKKCSLKGVAKDTKYNTSEYRKNLRVRNRLRNMVINAKSRAKISGLEFNITIKDLFIPLICPLLGISITVDNHSNKSTSPSIDRIDSSKGYIKGNVWIVSHRANTIKNDSTLEELQLITTNLGSCIKRMNCTNAEMPTCSQAIDTSIEGSETT